MQSNNELIHTELLPTRESLYEARVGNCVDEILLKIDGKVTICPEANTRDFCFMCSLSVDQSIH